MSADWHVGQKVAYVYSRPRPASKCFDVLRPQTGRVYTIRDIVLPPDVFELAFHLEEIVNLADLYVSPLGLPVAEKAFRASIFRPIVTDRTQFALLTSIADRVGKRDVVRT